MSRNWWFRFGFLSFLIVFALSALTPTLTGMKTQDWFIKRKINLGLDLQGGLYMVLGIDFNKVYKDELQTYSRKVISFLDDEGMRAELGEVNQTDESDPRQKIVFLDPTQVAIAKDKIEEFFGQVLRLVAQGDNSLTFAVGRDFKKTVEDTAVTKSIEVIRNRIDEFGVTEPEIVSQGEDRIVVQLPGVKDIDRAKDLIGKTAKLEFRFVNDDIAPAQLAQWVQKTKEAGIEFKKGERFSDYVEEVNKHLKADLPKGFRMYFAKEVNKVTNETTNLEPYLLESFASITGDMLQDARFQVDQQNNMPYVALDFKASGAKIFDQVTAKNVGRRMAIVLDGNVFSAPVINERISGGSAQITLGALGYNEAAKQATDLALVLRAGALPVELDFQEQRIVGPSLGADSIDKAELAGIIGAILVFAFIIFYYKTAGLFASITIVCNVILSLACLVGLEATLTLPGIAGIALTVGMAVDGNIIIYERIREELLKGGSPKEAIFLGFDKAFWTILDANLTTAIAGLCLLNFGTGPIRGFAVTLLIGIVTTVYTSYFVSKILFDFYATKSTKTLSI